MEKHLTKKMQDPEWVSDMEDLGFDTDLLK